MGVEGYRPPVVIDGCQYANWDREVFEQMRAGGVSCVNATIVYWENTRETLTRIAEWKRHFADNADLIVHAKSAADVHQAIADGRTAVTFALQHCSPIEEEIDLVEILHDLGVRYMQLSYNNQSVLATGWMEAEDPGITRFGREVIAEMNRLGMVIDMSHSAERSTLEAIEISTRPIAVTHANPITWRDTKRNKSDAVMKALGESGGMLGFSLYPHHLAGGSDCTLPAFCQMVAETAELMGVDRIGIGSDLVQKQPDSVVDWMRSGKWTKQTNASFTWPAPTSWFAGNHDLPGIAQGLLDTGFAKSDVDKIMGGNWLRFMESAFEPAG